MCEKTLTCWSLFCAPEAESFKPSCFKLSVFISRNFSKSRANPFPSPHPLGNISVYKRVYEPALYHWHLAQCLACSRNSIFVQQQHWSQRGGRNMRALSLVSRIIMSQSSLKLGISDLQITHEYFIVSVNWQSFRTLLAIIAMFFSSSPFPQNAKTSNASTDHWKNQRPCDVKIS